MNAGWKSSEFFATLSAVAGNVIAILVVLGKIKSDDKAVLTDAVGNIIAAFSVVIANSSVVWRYIGSRTEIKMEAIRVQNGHRASDQVSSEVRLAESSRED